MSSMKIRASALVLAFAGLAFAPGPLAARETPSGLPVPRFVSFKHKTAACRVGPSFKHPIEATYQRQGLPVEVIAETQDHWRRIRDFDGAECWVHQTTLKAVAGAIVAAPLTLYAEPRDNAEVKAYVERGVIVDLDGRKGEWRRIIAKGAKGWARADALWGVAR